MADVTVAQFAEVLKVPVERLLVQLEQAGIPASGENDVINDEAKLELLTHLRRSHGSEEGSAAPGKITLKRKTQSELKMASTQGRARTVNVEVRVKRTYVKRDVLEGQSRGQVDLAEQKRLEAEEAERLAQEKADQERREAERLETENRRRLEEEQSRNRQAEETRRAAEQQARENAERDAERQRQLRASESARTERSRSAPASSPAAAATPARPGAAAPGTRYGRQELHVSSDASARFKKKPQRRGMRGRPMPGDAQTSPSYG